MTRNCLSPVVVLLLLLVSCNRMEGLFSNRPSDVISKSQMVDVLVDMQLVESALRTSTVQPARGDSLLQKTYIRLFKKHHITKEQFEASLQYYIQDIEQLDAIYNEVISRLTAMEAERQLTSIKSDSTRKRELPDSITRKIGIGVQQPK